MENPILQLWELKEELRLKPLEDLSDAGVDPAVVDGLEVVSRILCPGKILDAAVLISYLMNI